MISKEAMKLFNKFSKIIDIIENRIELTKEEILTEVYIQLGSDYENIKKIFRKYYDGDCGIDGYIIKRKICRTIKEIININDKDLQNRKIEMINGKTRKEFSRMIKQRYNISLKDLLEGKEKLSMLEEPVDVKAIHKTFEKIEKSLKKLDELGIFDVRSKRTILQFSNVDIQKMFEILFMQNTYIYYGEIPKGDKDRIDYIVSMLGNDKILENWEVTKGNLENGEYGNYFTFKELANLDDLTQKELLDNSYYFLENDILENPLIINGLAYFIVNRSSLRANIEYFKLPNRLQLYETILFKTKAFMEEVCLYNITIALNDFDTEIIRRTKQKLLINSLYDIQYNYNLAIEEISKKMSKIEREIFYLIIYIEFTGNEEMDIEEGYKVIKEKYLDLTEKEYEDSFKELLIKGFISLRAL